MNKKLDFEKSNLNQISDWNIGKITKKRQSSNFTINKL
jgi:hypothetical protein